MGKHKERAIKIECLVFAYDVAIITNIKQTEKKLNKLLSHYMKSQLKSTTNIIKNTIYGHAIF